jgi:hypothetical protein
MDFFDCDLDYPWGEEGHPVDDSVVLGITQGGVLRSGDSPTPLSYHCIGVHG